MDLGFRNRRRTGAECKMKAGVEGVRDLKIQRTVRVIELPSHIKHLTVSNEE